MTITIEPELESRISLAAAQQGQDAMRYALNALLRQVEADAAPNSERSLRAEFEAAASDSLFLADVQETEQAFRTVDAQTAAMLDKD